MKMKTLLALIAQLSCLVEISSAKADTPSNGLPIPNELVAKTVAWQLHWDEKSGGANKSALKTIAIKNNDDLAVRVSPLDWIINFGNSSNQVFPNYVDKLEGPQDEVRQRAEQPFVHLNETIVNVPSYSSFVKVSHLKIEARKKIIAAVMNEAFNDESLEFFRKTDDESKTPLRIWVAPVDLSFPVILCFVDGTSYIGKVYFDTKTLNAVYSEFNYIGDPPAPWRKERLRLMKAIKAEGDVFEFKNVRSTSAVSGLTNQPPAYNANDSARTNVGNAPFAGVEKQLNDGQYVVTSGDNAAAICQKLQISMEELLTNNPGLNPKHLLVGQRLKIPTKPHQSD